MYIIEKSSTSFFLSSCARKEAARNLQVWYSSMLGIMRALLRHKQWSYVDDVTNRYKVLLATHPLLKAPHYISHWLDISFFLSLFFIRKLIPWCNLFIIIILKRLCKGVYTNIQWVLGDFESLLTWVKVKGVNQTKLYPLINVWRL